MHPHAYRALRTMEFAVSTGIRTLPQTTTSKLFEVKNGPVSLVQIVGKCTTAVPAGTNNLKILHISNGITTDLCAVVDVAPLVVGDLIRITGTAANAAVIVSTGVPTIRQAAEYVLDVGFIYVSCSASTAGAIKWGARFLPLGDDADVQPAYD